MKLKTNLLLFVIALLAIEPVMAQEQGIFRINGGLAYGSKFGMEEDLSDSKGALGFNIGAEYLVSEKIGLALAYSQYAKQNGTISEDGFTVDAEAQFSSIDFDLRYYFITDGPLVYGLIGYSSVKVSVEVSLFGISDKQSETENAFNLGMGAIFPFSEKIGLTTQLKWQKLPDDAHFVGNLGIAFRLN